MEIKGYQPIRWYVKCLVVLKGQAVLTSRNTLIQYYLFTTIFCSTIHSTKTQNGHAVSLYISLFIQNISHSNHLVSAVKRHTHTFVTSIKTTTYMQVIAMIHHKIYQLFFHCELFFLKNNSGDYLLGSEIAS